MKLSTFTNQQPYPKEIQSINNALGFSEVMEAIQKENNLTLQEAFNIVNHQHNRLFGYLKYTSLSSFRVCLAHKYGKYMTKY